MIVIVEMITENVIITEVSVDSGKLVATLLVSSVVVDSKYNKCLKLKLLRRCLIDVKRGRAIIRYLAFDNF